MHEHALTCASNLCGTHVCLKYVTSSPAQQETPSNIVILENMQGTNLCPMSPCLYTLRSLKGPKIYIFCRTGLICLKKNRILSRVDPSFDSKLGRSWTSAHKRSHAQRRTVVLPRFAPESTPRLQTHPNRPKDAPIKKELKI